MWELDHKEGWVLKNWCFWTAVLDKTLESLLDSKIKPVNPKGNQPWLVTGRTEAKAEASIFLAIWCEELSHWKRPWCWERLRAGSEGDDDENEIVGWHRQLQEHEFERTLGDSEEQGSLSCCHPWGRNDSDMTQRLSNNSHENNILRCLLTHCKAQKDHKPECGAKS